MVEVVQAQEESPRAISEMTEGMQRFNGFFDLYWEESTGHLYWEFKEIGQQFLYQVSLSSGLGSNPVGLDRGQLGSTAILQVHRVGPRVLLMEPNYKYRARSENPDEVRAVEDAFAPSIHWGFVIEAETENRLLVDATDFFLRDTHGAALKLENAGQGNYELDRTRSVFHVPHTKAFPKNNEVETILTFTSKRPGELVESVAASGEAITLRQRHSIVALPDGNYMPRLADPRIGVFGPKFLDYATPIDKPFTVRWVARHRLEKMNPNASTSVAIKPLTYYVDRGAPEPIRSALVEGAQWWNEAFEAAGFIDGFRVEILPLDADPMDIRYNMIHWTHRSTRGWSYGGSVSDPRTGEIIKGNVNLGSLRLRQDYLIGQGLLSAVGDTGSLSGCGLSDSPGFEYLATVANVADPVEMALARVRQLSAHEVGHTLGFPHNYLASTYGRRASVMDYPAPLVGLRDGEIDLSDAYGVGIGEYDKLAVRWLYSHFPTGTNHTKLLEAIVIEGLRKEIRFMTYINNVIADGAHPLASVWDNGADPVNMLQHEILVRQIGLQKFGPHVIQQGEPMSVLEQALVPLYLHHRYQLKAAANTLGGTDYYYALKGDGQTPVTIVPGKQQRIALETMLETLRAQFLAIPERILEMIPPPAYRYEDGEMFDRFTGLNFDPLAAASASADYTVAIILQGPRMARLVEHNARSKEYPGLGEVVEQMYDATWFTESPRNTYHLQIQRIAQRSVVDGLLREASSGKNPSYVRAILSDKLDTLAKRLNGSSDANVQLVLGDIRRWQDRPEGVMAPAAISDMPPGSPIGAPK